MLETYRYGEPGSAPPLLIAHGLFGSARNFASLAKRLSKDRLVICVDMRNHGASPWFNSHRYTELADDLAAVIRAHGGPMDVLGHSMGGKAAMMLALTHPDTVAKLTVADIAPVAYAHDQRPFIEAMRQIDPGAIGSRKAANTALAAHIDQAGIRAFLLQSLDLKAGRWRMNLDVLDREMHQLTGWPEPEATSEHATLFLSGSESQYITPAYRPAMRRAFPKARFVKIPGAGHWLHADAPEAFEATLQTWLTA
ncbi:MAG: alpha/beta fold hydrolase [Pseudomonadota bacterium]